MFARCTQHKYAEWAGRSHKRIEPQDGVIRHLGKVDGPAPSPTFVRHFDKPTLYQRHKGVRQVLFSR